MPRVAPKDDLRIVTMNILHGIVCPNAPDDCQGDDRMALLGQQLQAAKCPQVVALEEIAPRTYERVLAAPWVKQCKYKIVWHDMPLTDRELVLTTLPVTSQKLTVLAGNFRSAYRVEMRSKLGPLVLVATHQDGDPRTGRPQAVQPGRVPTRVHGRRHALGLPDDPGDSARLRRRRGQERSASSPATST